MTNYNGALIDGIFLELVAGTRDLINISGTLTNGTDPIKRQIVVYRHPQYELPTYVWPDDDGEWTVTLNGNISDRFIVIALGDQGEINAVSNWITL